MPTPTPVPQPQPDPDGRPGPHDPPGPRPRPGDPVPDIPDHLRPPRRCGVEGELPPSLQWNEELGMYTWRAAETVDRPRAAFVASYGFTRVGGGSLY